MYACACGGQLPLREALKQPSWVDIDDGKRNRQAQLHLGFQALDLWAKHHGSYPHSYHRVPADANFSLDQHSFRSSISRTLPSKK
jgi:hypothetical protein